MGYSIAFLGDLSFPAGRATAWEASSIDPSAFADWPEDFRPSGGEALTIGELLDEAHDDFLELDRTDATIRLRLLTSKDDGFYLDRRGAALCAFRQAAAFGGVGELVIVGWMDAPDLGARVTTTADGTTTCSDLDADEIKEVEKGAAYAELEAIVARGIDALPGPDLAALVAKDAQAIDRVAAEIASAPDIEGALSLLRQALPTSADHSKTTSIPRLPVIAAIAAHHDLRATEGMLAALRGVLGGPIAGELEWKRGLTDADRIFALALLWSLHRRGGADEAVVDVWIDHPDWFLRNHEAVRALGRRELDVRLASLLGRFGDDNYLQQWVVEALMASDPEGAPARARRLLEGDPRKDKGALEGLRFLACYFYDRPEARSPAWEQFLRDVDRLHPWSTQPYDFYDQIRCNAIGQLANWGMPEALAPIAEHFDAFGVARACGFLEELGAEAIPVLSAKLATTRRKADRSLLEKTIAKLSGAPAAPTAPKGNTIEVSPSGRAACRGCKEKIAKGELRFGEAVKNVFDESGEPTMRWYHLRCAAEKKPLLFTPVLAAYGGDIPERASLQQRADERAVKKRVKKKEEE